MKSVKKRAFTLIEMLLVLVILAALAALVVPRFTGRSEQARVTAAKVQISAIATALKSFETNVGRFPTESEGLGALVHQPGNASGWLGPYLEKQVPLDPWDNPYIYRHPARIGIDFDVISTGPDGLEGTEDDIVN